MSIATRKFNIVKLLLSKSIFDENIITIILKCYWNILNCEKKILVNWINIEKLPWGKYTEYPIQKLNWIELSSNPNAISLLKKRIEYEKSVSLEDEVYYYNTGYWSEDTDEFKFLNKINWYWLSCNPNAINLLKENKDKINWSWLSVNPAIFEDESMPII